MKTGERIKLMRVLHGLDQHGAADLTNIQQAKVAKYETGKHVPRLGVVAKFAEAFNCRQRWLMEGLGEPFTFCYSILPPPSRDPKRAGERSGEDLRQLLPLLFSETRLKEYYVVRVGKTTDKIFVFGLGLGWTLVIKAERGMNTYIEYAISELAKAQEINISQEEFDLVLGDDIEHSAAQLRLLFDSLMFQDSGGLFQDYLEAANIRERRKIWKFRMVLSIRDDEGITQDEAQRRIEEAMLDYNIMHSYENK